MEGEKSQTRPDLSGTHLAKWHLPTADPNLCMNCRAVGIISWLYLFAALQRLQNRYSVEKELSQANPSNLTTTSSIRTQNRSLVTRYPILQRYDLGRDHSLLGCPCQAELKQKRSKPRTCPFSLPPERKCLTLSFGDSRYESSGGFQGCLMRLLLH